jgi:hypothetical protein
VYKISCGLVDVLIFMLLFAVVHLASWKCVKTLPQTFAKKKLHHSTAPSHTSFFTRGFLTKNNMTIIPHPPNFSLFPIEVIEAESEAVLNTLRIRLPGYIKKMADVLAMVQMCKRDYFEGDGGQ